jgi:hypothetical protein
MRGGESSAATKERTRDVRSEAYSDATRGRDRAIVGRSGQHQFQSIISFVFSVPTDQKPVV